jgi:hypothetical protein
VHDQVIWLVLACRPPVRVVYGPAATVPVRRPPSDPKRMYLLDEHGRTWFFDTGYAKTTCDDDLVTELGLPTRGRVTVRGASGRVSASLATLPTLALGGHEVHGLRCTVRDLPTTSSLGDGVVGVLGMDLLRRFRLELAPARDHVLLAEPAEDTLVGAIPFRNTPGRGYGLRLPLELPGARVWTLVDTGASSTCIDAARLPIEVEEVGRVSVRGTGHLGGQVVSTWSARGLSLAGHPVPDVHVVSLPRPWYAPDLLGLDVLTGFELTWDFARGEVLVAPHTPPQ